MIKSPPYPALSRFLAPPTSYQEPALQRAVKNRIVLVSGASYGIGRALALRLGKAGAHVLLLARTRDRLEEVRDLIVSAGGSAELWSVDLRDSEDIDQVTRDILDRHPLIDVVVHNAGKSIRRSLLNSLDRPHDFERTMGVNYLGPVRLQLAFLPGMMERRGGQIINVSSVSVRLPPAAHWAAYHASKSAFDLWLAAGVSELSRYDIQCTSAYMGLVHTRMSAPTESYAGMPGLTADQAASTLCRAIVRRPRVVQPWWLGPARVLTVPVERLSEWIQCRVVGP